eukprot:3219822-Rhodomonas_salina.3
MQSHFVAGVAVQKLSDTTHRLRLGNWRETLSQVVAVLYLRLMDPQKGGDPDSIDKREGQNVTLTCHRISHVTDHSSLLPAREESTVNSQQSTVNSQTSSESRDPEELETGREGSTLSSSHCQAAVTVSDSEAEAHWHGHGRGPGVELERWTLVTRRLRVHSGTAKSKTSQHTLSTVCTRNVFSCV